MNSVASLFTGFPGQPIDTEENVICSREASVVDRRLAHAKRSDRNMCLLNRLVLIK